MSTASMEPLDLTAVLTPDFWFQQFANFEGLHTGVPTRTTPTITPTTLRNIEQTFFELTRETERAEPHHNEAGFVPPVIEPVRPGGATYMSLVDSKAWIGGNTTITPVQAHIMSNRPTVVNTSTANLPIMQASPAPTRRNMGGRRPIKNAGISPEEEERRRVRRERNKQAAARCRKRRMDHTNELLKETDGLESKRQELQSQIQELQAEKDHLEFILEAHSQNCRLIDNPPSPPDIKPIIFDGDEETKVIVKQEPRLSETHPHKLYLSTHSGNKPSRPSSLPVAAFTPHKSASTILEVAGVPITTPSAGIPFNFDSLMEGGTGLTPVSGTGPALMIPSCSSQQRNGGVDLSSPDGTFPPKLVSL